METTKQLKAFAVKERSQCILRGKDGRCTPNTQSCGSVERRICDSLQYAYARGYKDGYMEREVKT